jgi:hypothetical protein
MPGFLARLDVAFGIAFGGCGGYEGRYADGNPKGKASGPETKSLFVTL